MGLDFVWTIHDDDDDDDDDDDKVDSRWTQPLASNLAEMDPIYLDSHNTWFGEFSQNDQNGCVRIFSYHIYRLYDCVCFYQPYKESILSNNCIDIYSVII